jgi:hypothetical protein
MEMKPIHWLEYEEVITEEKPYLTVFVIGLIIGFIIGI